MPYLQPKISTQAPVMPHPEEELDPEKMTDDQKVKAVDDKVAFLESLFGDDSGKQDEGGLGLGDNIQDMMKEC